ncbi:hypothetical protein ONZ45_g4402 [Pleurotus djamor]|nr:hypothetical protein ONZ45_g4402 [Pleurotus djamor]
MPRTTQGAKKTTGAPAERKEMAPRQEAAKNAVKKNVKQQSVKAKTVKSKALADDHTGPATNEDTAPVKGPITRAVQALSGSQVLECPNVDLRGSLCHGCHNGGELVPCSTCSVALCFRVDESEQQVGTIHDRTCLVLKSGTSIALFRFRCLRCHLLDDSLAKTSTPYAGFYTLESGLPSDVLLDVSQTSVRFLRPVTPVNTIMIGITVEGCQDLEEPMTLAYQRNAEYYSRSGVSLASVKLPFNFDHVGKSNQYDKAVRALVKDLPKYQNVIVFFTTHSTPEGRLHFGQSVVAGKVVPASLDAKAVLDRAFPDVLIDALRNVARSTLFYMVCSGAERRDSYEWMRSLILSEAFNHIISFTNSVQPYFAAPLAADYLRLVYIERELPRECMVRALAGTGRLGAANDVYLMERLGDPKSIEAVIRHHYFFAEYDKKPYGFPKPAWCPRCRGLRSLTTREERNKLVQFQCESNLPPFSAKKDPSNLPPFDAKKAPSKRKPNQKGDGPCKWVGTHHIPVGKVGMRGANDGSWFAEKRSI